MDHLNTRYMEQWVNLIKGRGGVFALAQDGTAIDVMKNDVKPMGLIGKSLIAIKHIGLALPPHPWSHAD